MGTNLVGTEILGYRITEFVAAGGMASVWKAVHVALDERVRAVKILNPVLARDPSLVERFDTEARTQARLQHENIVAIENYSVEHLAILMEWVDGASLDRLLVDQGGKLPLPRVLHFMRQILSAIGYAHAKGIVHRDIKPGNVLVRRDGLAKLSDFGIIRIVGGARMTQHGSFVGTATYVSPEQVRGAGDVDGRSDLYALGVTLFELLTGQPPFDSKTATQSDFALRLAHVQERPPDPRTLEPSIPEPVARVILRALEKSPAARFASADEMWRALDAAARTHPTATAGARLAARPPGAEGPSAPRPVLRGGAPLPLAPAPGHGDDNGRTSLLRATGRSPEPAPEEDLDSTGAMSSPALVGATRDDSRAAAPSELDPPAPPGDPLGDDGRAVSYLALPRAGEESPSMNTNSPERRARSSARTGPPEDERGHTRSFDRDAPEAPPPYEDPYDVSGNGPDPYGGQEGDDWTGEDEGYDEYDTQDGAAADNAGLYVVLSAVFTFLLAGGLVVLVLLLNKLNE